MKLCTVTELKAYLEITNTDYDTLLGNLIDYISGEIQNHIGYSLETGSITEYRSLDLGQYLVYLRGYPITAVSKVYLDDYREFGTSTLLVENTDYTWDSRKLNLIYGSSYQGIDIMKVQYTAGYVLSGVSANLPHDLKFVAIRESAIAFKRRKDIGLTNVNMQLGTIQLYMTDAFDKKDTAILDKYKRKMQI